MESALAFSRTSLICFCKEASIASKIAWRCFSTSAALKPPKFTFKTIKKKIVK